MTTQARLNAKGAIAAPGALSNIGRRVTYALDEGATWLDVHLDLVGWLRPGEGLTVVEVKNDGEPADAGYFGDGREVDIRFQARGEHRVRLVSQMGREWRGEFVIG